MMRRLTGLMMTCAWLVLMPAAHAADVAAGKVKHSKTKVELNETEIANIAAYWLTGKK